MTKKYSYISIGAILLSFLLVLMPFHAAIVTIAGNYLPYKLLLQGWKEFLIFIIGLFCIYAIYKDKSLLKFHLINKLAIFLVVFSLIISVLSYSDLNALLAGIKTNIIVLILFLEAQILSSKFSFDKLFKIVMIPACIVAIIAILQPVLFKPEIIERFGYNTNSIISGQFVESSTSSIRVFSTLGGPNQLGAYLIIPFALVFTRAIKTKRVEWFLMSAFFLIPVYLTYSRSAWLGLIISAATVLTLQFKPKTQLIVGVSLFLLLGVIGFSIYSKGVCKYFSKPVTLLIHGDCNAGSLGGSDMIRINSINSGIQAIKHQPLGSGLGAAGPASFYGKNPLIVENWYLQIAIEIGIVGLIGYLLFIILIMRRLYLLRNSNQNEAILTTALFATICGLAITSLFLHTLADSTLSIILFALLGITIGPHLKKATV